MKYLLPYTCLLILFYLAACSNESKSPDTLSGTETSPQEFSIQKVGVVHPVARTFNSDVGITGTAMPYQKVSLHAMESGFVQSITKDIGDFVSKGVVIASLQNPELISQLKEQEAHVKRAAAAVLKVEAEQKKWKAISVAKKTIFERLEKTYQKYSNIVLAADVDNARADYETAKANLLGAEADITVANSQQEAAEAMLEAVRSRVGMLQVKAPFSGIITKRYVDNGATILSGMVATNSPPIVDMQDISKIRLTVQLPEADAAHIKRGSDVKITFPELSDVVITAKVSRSASTLDASSRTMQVEIDLGNKDGEIKPGMYAKVQLNAQSRTGKLSVPTAAKMLIDDIPHILLVENAIVKAVPLSKGLEGRDFFEILNNEVTKKSQIILQGKNLVKSGQRVEAKLLEN